MADLKIGTKCKKLVIAIKPFKNKVTQTAHYK